jgi:hypothetical protein
VGDRVRFEDAEHEVVAIDGTTLRLTAPGGRPWLASAAFLAASPGFAVVGGASGQRPAMPPFALLDAVTESAADRARFWESHILEVITGLPAGAAEGLEPRPEFDPRLRMLSEREAAKVAELTAAGEQVSTRTLGRLRKRYEEQGLWGLVDQRYARTSSQFGRVDERVIDAITAAVDEQTDASTGTRDPAWARAREILSARHPGLVLLNRHQVSARRGLIVTGGAGTGKTTAHPARPQPRAAAAAPPRPAGRRRADAGRLRHGPARRHPEDARLGVRPVRWRPGRQPAKYLAERIPATFVYAGINVEASGLFAGTRGQQIAGRFGVISCDPFPYGTAGQRQQWQALIATLEQSLRLHRHEAGQLLRLDAYLHDRTDGMIGSLSHLIRGAAVEAVIDGTERITRQTLDRVGLDHAAEGARTRRKAAVRRRRDSAG